MAAWRSILPLAGLLIPMSNGCMSMARVADDRLLTLESRAVAPLDVATDNGQVEVVVDPALAEVRVEARVTATSYSESAAAARLAGVDVHAGWQADGVLRVRAEFPGGRRMGEGCSLRVFLPGVDGVTVATSNGAIVLSGTAGNAALRSSNGDLRVSRHRGMLTAATSNGGVSVHGIDGPLRIDTSNGPVEVAGAAGPVAVSSSNASISLLAPSSGRAPLDLRSSNGDIEVTLPGNPVLTLLAETSNGAIVVTDPFGLASCAGSARSRTIQLGAGGATASARTSNGTVRVTVGG